ncbi:DUF4142 domain-containing protein [Dyadobacter subterraneus]|uniref:DUF4142 domain-containing protein n=1 Tax=Dyadobacter subterraneus TaxID=2773304 RepID=A0ABR9WCW8_9BACT|nr:DUF4142 domain-containing protein [Dyadobacter subterraneus]MBE9462216.1 DUF4142 domain-containing protein [Dyadobacter subterraneus]
MKNYFIYALILAGSQFLSQHSYAQSVQNQDADFVQKAAEGGMLEVNLGQLALKKAEAKQVKDFAKMMVDDHTKENEELMTLSKKKKFDMPATFGSAKQMMCDSLSSKSGNTFDMIYMNMMIASHEETIGLFQREATGGKDADLKKWATAKLPALKHHLEMAKMLFKTN